jgi:hypothetical protein
VKRGAVSPLADAGDTKFVSEQPPFSKWWFQYRLTEGDRTPILEAIFGDPWARPV